MDKVETYTYTRNDLVNSIQTIKYPEGNTDKKCAISNVAAPLYACSDVQIGVISFTNNFSEFGKFSFTTSIGTIITPLGSLVVNFNFETLNQFLPNNKTVTAKPTFTSGIYSNYKDITVTIFSLDDIKSTRILTINY